MKICYEKIETVDEVKEKLVSELDYVAGELECPTWMLGNVYRYKLATRKRELEKRIREIEYG